MKKWEKELRYWRKNGRREISGEKRKIEATRDSKNTGGEREGYRVREGRGSEWER